MPFLTFGFYPSIWLKIERHLKTCFAEFENEDYLLIRTIVFALNKVEDVRNLALCSALFEELESITKTVEVRLRY